MPKKRKAPPGVDAKLLIKDAASFCRGRRVGCFCAVPPALVRWRC